MPLKLDEFNGMELLWRELPKRPDKDHVTLTIDDIDSMWDMGVVDTRQYGLDVWRSTFDGHRQADGTYILNKEEFLAKEEYRYKGEIMVPFNAMKINEGKYTDEGLQELTNSSIAPSCSLPPSELKKFIDGLKEQFREAEGLIKIDSRTKHKIKKLLDDHPSPLRRLEMLFDYLLKEEEIKGELAPVSEEAMKAAAPYAVSPEQLARIQASSFSVMPISDVEIKARGLRAIQKTLPKHAAAEKTTTTIKKIKRSRKGTRG